MELKIKHGLSKTVITDTENKTLFIIKGTNFFKSGKIILSPDGTPVYSVMKALKPLDHRDKYIFTDCISKNEFFAWIDRDIFKKRKSSPLYKCFLFSPLEIYIEAESFFGELCIRRGGISEFDILINGSKHGSITNRKITCDTIDDAALLSVLYVFSTCISRGEELCRTADAI